MFKLFVSVKICYGFVFFFGFWVSWKVFLEVEMFQYVVLEIMINKLVLGLYSWCMVVFYVFNVEGFFVVVYVDGNVFVYDKVS